MRSRRRPRVGAGRAARRSALLLALALTSVGAGAPLVRAAEPGVAADGAGSDTTGADAAPGGATIADRTTVGLGSAATFDPASPSFEVELRRFVGPHVGLGMRQEGGFTAGRDARWRLATSAFAQVHPLEDPKPRLSPFVGVAGGVLHGGGDAAGTVGPEAGVVIFLADELSLEARYQLRWASDRVAGLDAEQHLAWLGVRVLLSDGSGADLARAEKSAARAEKAAAKAEEAVARLEAAVGRLEAAVELMAAQFARGLEK